MKFSYGLILGISIGLTVSFVVQIIYRVQIQDIQRVKVVKRDYESEQQVTIKYENVTTTENDEVDLQTVPTTFVNNTNDTIAFLAAMEHVQAERQATMAKACEKYKQKCGNTFLNANPASLFSRNYNFTVCELQKCGSTSWQQGVLVLDGVYNLDDFFADKITGMDVFNTIKSKHRLNSLRNFTEVHLFWKNALNIITVRDPFERLISAFNNKMIPGKEGYTSYYGPMSEKIYEKYKELRSNPSDPAAPVGTASFEDFVNAILANDKMVKNDYHWLPYVHVCKPCMFTYNYIAKFESLNEDISYIKHVQGIRAEISEALFRPKTYRSNSEKVEEMFKTIPLKTKRKLFAIYERDFAVFGYKKPLWVC